MNLIGWADDSVRLVIDKGTLDAICSGRDIEEDQKLEQVIHHSL